MAHRVPITIRVDHFEGPLDLLLYLVQTHEMDINKISISKITDQYLGYVRLMQELNFDIASEFLLMAATLIYWKSKSLLPQENVDGVLAANAGDEALTQEELIRQLLEHQRFLEMGQNIAGLPTLGIDTFTRPNRRPPTEKVWKEMNISDLSLCFQDILVRARKRTHILKKETVSVGQKIFEFGSKLKLGQAVDIRDLISIPGSRPETVVTFLASLELSRLKKTKLYQQEVYAAIYVELIETLIGFDPSLAIGFDSPIAEAERRAQDHSETQTDELTGRLIEFLPGGGVDQAHAGPVSREPITDAQTDDLHKDARDAYAAFQGAQHFTSGTLPGNTESQETSSIPRGEEESTDKQRLGGNHEA